MATNTRQNTGKANNDTNGNNGNGNGAGERSGNLRDSEMMAHLMDALEKGTDIGHYGRLTFAMVARHFLGEDEMLRLLGNQEGGEEEARRLLVQVQARDYNPPKRERILQWQQEQEFPICPNPDDPDACNVYRDLRFPDDIYESIEEYYEEKAEAQQS
ncbi:MAG TPA: hypothetical protein VF914_03350 [Chloroflexia bacterium]|jgi:hypothetical protein